LSGSEQEPILTDRSVSFEHHRESHMQSLPTTKASYSTGEQAILDAAESLFAEKGFDAVSMSAIARLAKTSKPNIYHHFKNKDDLYLAVMKTAVQRSSALLDSLEDAPGTHGQHLADFSAGQLQNILAHSRSTQLILREALSTNSQRGQEIAKHVVGGVFNRIVAMVRSGQQANEFREGPDPALAAFMIVAANMFFFQAGSVMQYLPEADFSADAGAFSKGVMDIMFHGLIKEGTIK